MSTYTAAILIGHSHQNHGGIIPSYNIFLSENDRPALILSAVNISSEESYGKIIWIPTIDNLLEDILLMISINIFKNLKLSKEFYKLLYKKNLDHIELLKNFTSKELNILYQINKEFLDNNNNFKIAFSIFEGSALEGHLQKLESYSMDIEICKSCYNRCFSAWENKIIINGEL